MIRNSPAAICVISSNSPNHSISLEIMPEEEDGDIGAGDRVFRRAVFNIGALIHEKRETWKATVKPDLRLECSKDYNLMIVYDKSLDWIRIRGFEAKHSRSISSLIIILNPSTYWQTISVLSSS